MRAEDLDKILPLLALAGVVIVVAMVVLFGFFLSKRNSLIQKQLRSELDYQKRLHATELKALRGQMNPHFVHNSLNAIQYYIQRNEVEISENYLVKFSKLIRLFFEYSRRQYVTIEEEQELLEHYLQIEKLRFEDKINYRIVVDSEIDTEECRLPAMMLQPIVENAVNHGLFHKKGEGNIHIHFEYINEESFRVRIEDDGIGINKAKEIYKKSSKKYQSNSSAVLQERLTLLQENSEWDFVYSIQDISELREATGTLVSLTFKNIDDE